MQPIKSWIRLSMYGILCLFGVAACLAVGWMLFPFPVINSPILTVVSPSKHTARIYEVSSLIGHPGEEAIPSASPPPLASALTREFSEIIAATRLFGETNCVGRNGEKVYVESRAYRADACFFEVFENIPIAGNPQLALTQPYTVVLTEGAALRYFGKEDALHRQLIFNHELFTVTAVVADPGPTAPIQFEVLLSMATHSGMQENKNWTWNVMKTYLRLHEHASVIDLENRLSVVVDKYARPTLGQSFDQWQSRGGKLKYFLQAV